MWQPSHFVGAFLAASFEWQPLHFVCMASLKDAMHVKCKDCHAKDASKKAPTKCDGCHKK